MPHQRNLLWREACPLQQLSEPLIAAHILEKRVAAEPPDEYLSPIVGIVKPSEALVEVTESRIDESEEVYLDSSALVCRLQLLGQEKCLVSFPCDRVDVREVHVQVRVVGVGFYHPLQVEERIVPLLPYKVICHPSLRDQ